MLKASIGCLAPAPGFLVQHFHLPARGLLSLFSLLRAFLLNATKRNQEKRQENVPSIRAPKIVGRQCRSALAVGRGGGGWGGGVGLRLLCCLLCSACLAALLFVRTA